MQTLMMTLNGHSVELKVRPSDTLLRVLRERCGLMGSKEGCGQGDCGACTVLLDGQPVNACITPALKASGRNVLTIEGVTPADGSLHPIQQAMVAHGAIQCGFCTSGMVMTIKALLDHNPHPDRGEIREAISGNLCRCAGYEFIIDAVQSLSSQDVN